MITYCPTCANMLLGGRAAPGRADLVPVSHRSLPDTPAPPLLQWR
jgi:hypothetical protein